VHSKPNLDKSENKYINIYHFKVKKTIILIEGSR
jgi:hypothetical protein